MRAQLMDSRVRRSRSDPHPVDLHVGERLRARRKLMNLSQVSLAESVGVAYPQIQKYERGANRISASMLYELAHVLKTPVEYFFLGLPNPAANSSQQAVAASATLNMIEEFALTTDGAELTSILIGLPLSLRRRVVNIAREISAIAAESNKHNLSKAS